MHVPGELNVFADYLSRLEVNSSEKEREVNATNSSNVTREILAADKDQIIKIFHDMGHFGVKLTHKRLLQHGYVWVGIKRDVERIAGRCDACMRHTPSPTIKHALTSLVVAKPLDHIALDLVTPIPADNMGNDTLFVLVDLATRYVWMKALDGKNMN